jgi:hypothetical protein
LIEAGFLCTLLCPPYMHTGGVLGPGLGVLGMKEGHREGMSKAAYPIDSHRVGSFAHAGEAIHIPILK